MLTFPQLVQGEDSNTVSSHIQGALVLMDLRPTESTPMGDFLRSVGFHINFS